MRIAPPSRRALDHSPSPARDRRDYAPRDATASRAEAVLLTTSFMKRVLKILCIATVGALTSLSPPQLAMAGPHGTGGGPAGGGGSFGGPPGAGGGGRSFGSFADHMELSVNYPVAVGEVERSVVCLVVLEEEAVGAAVVCAASTAVGPRPGGYPAFVPLFQGQIAGQAQRPRRARRLGRIRRKGHLGRHRGRL